MSNLEIISIVLIILYGILAVLYVFLNENVKDLNMLMDKQTSLFRELLQLMTDDEEEDETPAPDDHWMQAREYTLNAIKDYPITDEVLKEALASRMNYTTWLTIKECIELLSTDGKGTKQQVKEKLEELIKDER